MGKPYLIELERLTDTYDWAMQTDISAISQSVKTTRVLPIIASGSGGALSLAELMVSIHTQVTGRLAKALTPLELIEAMPTDEHLGIWLMSAGGTNIDILRAFSSSVTREPSQLVVICGRPKCKLVDQVKKHSYVDLHTFSHPAGKDGFLATNSLVAFAVPIARAYLGQGEVSILPSTLSQLLCTALGSESQLSDYAEQSMQLWKRETTVVLHSSVLRPAALDIESRFTEAALGSVQVSDFRNFAHGRHHWLAKRGESSGVLAISTPRDRQLAERTLNILPSHIPKLHVKIMCDDVAGQIASMIIALHTAGWAGKSKGIDPGRPSVPTFGRKLYNLKRAPIRKSKISHNDFAIWRKTGVALNDLQSWEGNAEWNDALERFHGRICDQAFGAIVFDYDGTIVDTQRRFSPPSPEMIAELVKLLDAGILIGIATGRGISVKDSLTQVVPKKHWPNIFVGYYNGAEFGTIDDDGTPIQPQTPCQTLRRVERELRSVNLLLRSVDFHVRRSQIGVMPRKSTSVEWVWEMVGRILQKLSIPRVRYVKSAHSVDILAPGVSKLRVVSEIHKLLEKKSTTVLTIGDRGRWSGNDFELLSEPFSLSVDEVSSDPDTCWNLSSPGIRGSQATIQYCQRLTIRGRRGHATAHWDGKGPTK